MHTTSFITPRSTSGNPANGLRYYAHANGWDEDAEEYFESAEEDLGESGGGASYGHTPGSPMRPASPSREEEGLDDYAWE